MHVLQDTEAIDVIEAVLFEGKMKGVGLDDMAILVRSCSLEGWVDRSRKIGCEVLLLEASGDLGMSSCTTAYLKPNPISKDCFWVNVLRQPLWKAVSVKVRSPCPLVPK